MTAPSNAALAALAHAEAEARPPRTPQRRAAAALWTVLIATRTIRGARLALAAIPDQTVRADAASLLDRLAAQADSKETPKK